MNDATSDAEYLLRLPRTKGAVKAIYTVNGYSEPEEILNANLKPSKFLVGGGSKRG